MAYGSSVFKQNDRNNKEELMLDLIFAVDDPMIWHTENLKMNWQHYSAVKYLGPSVIKSVQSAAAGVYFNTCWPTLKYGVVETSTLVRDLNNWDTFYIAGRMQKPVLILKEHIDVKVASRVNLAHAFKVAILLLPAKFSLGELFATISSLSYAGDIRTSLGWEHPKKVSNIVQHNLKQFFELYRHWIETYLVLESSVQLNEPSFDDKYVRLENTDVVKLFECQPERLIARTRKLLQDVSINESLIDTIDFKVALKKSVSSIVSDFSTIQTLKGAITSPMCTNVQYVLRKIKQSMK